MRKARSRRELMLPCTDTGAAALVRCSHSPHHPRIQTVPSTTILWFSLPRTVAAASTIGMRASSSRRLRARCSSTTIPATDGAGGLHGFGITARLPWQGGLPGRTVCKVLQYRQSGWPTEIGASLCILVVAGRRGTMRGKRVCAAAARAVPNVGGMDRAACRE